MDEILSKEVEITLKEKKITLSFPTVKQTIKIETAKQVLTDGRYALMAFSGMSSTNDLLDIVDTMAFFSALLPNIYKVAGVKDAEEFMELPMDSEIIGQMALQYKTVYQPWFNERYERVDRPKSALGVKAEPKKKDKEKPDEKEG